jgi:hypothetical protein
VSIRKAIFTHDLELNVGKLRRRIDLPMRAQALLGFVLEVLAALATSFGSRFNSQDGSAYDTTTGSPEGGPF